MYPRNAASPERIAVGPVVQISDGAVQTSGCSVKVMPQGGAASAGGGTVAYEEGIVHYLPTQAETNYTSFMVIAYKASCIPASVTVMTTASATAGKVVLSGETHTSAVIPAVTDVTNLHAAAATAAELAKVPKSDSTVTWNATALASINAEVDSALNTAIPGSPTANSINERVATMDGLLLGTVAAGTHNPQSGDAYARLGAPAGASIAADLVVIDNFVDDLEGRLTATRAGYLDNLSTAPPAASAIADAVWDELLSGHSGAGSAGLALSTASSGGVDPSVLADAIWDEALSGHSTAGTAGKALTDVLEDTGTTLDTLIKDVPTNSEFEARTLASASYATASALDTVDNFLDTEVAAILAAVDTEVAAIKAKTDNLPSDPADQSAVEAAITAATSPLATAASLAAAKAILDKFNTMVVLDGAVYDFTAAALAAAPGGTGSDPLANAVPGSYDPGTAGYVIGTYLDAAISGVGGAVGSGADSVTVTWTVDSVPVADADVWITTDSAGNNVIAGTLQTNTSGEATFKLDAGEVYYMWGQKSGVNSLKGVQFTAVAD